MTRKRKKRRKTKSRRSTAPIERPLLVFISSVIAELQPERAVVETMIRDFGIAQPWRFETTPASSDPVDEAYLQKVRECDIFVLIVAHRDSSAVQNEYELALECNKPVLAFVRDEQRSSGLQSFVDQITMKYSVYTGATELGQQVRAALTDEVLRKYRWSINPSRVRQIVKEVPSPSVSSQPQEILGAVLLGVDNDPVVKMLEMFGGVSTSSPYPVGEGFEDLVFDDFAEFAEVFNSLREVQKRASQTQGDPNVAFEREWKEMLIVRLSNWLSDSSNQSSIPNNQEYSGLSYIVMRIKNEYVPIIKYFRFSEITGTHHKIDRGATEILFEDPLMCVETMQAIHEANMQAAGDMQEFRRLLIQSSLRVRLAAMDLFG